MRAMFAAMALCLFSVPSLADVSNGKEFLRKPYTKSGSLTIAVKGKKYRGQAFITVTPRNARGARNLRQSARKSALTVATRNAAVAGDRRAEPVQWGRNIFADYAALPKGNVTLRGVVAPLAAKAVEIVNACGARVVSAMRNTLIAGTRTRSLHASGKAVDLAGNPSCIYPKLAGWPGGYSTDYARVRHVHISYDPAQRREWGVRFTHYSARRKVKRNRYASAR